MWYSLSFSPFIWVIQNIDRGIFFYTLSSKVIRRLQLKIIKFVGQYLLFASNYQPLRFY